MTQRQYDEQQIEKDNVTIEDFWELLEVKKQIPPYSKKQLNKQKRGNESSSFLRKYYKQLEHNDEQYYQKLMENEKSRKILNKKNTKTLKYLFGREIQQAEKQNQGEQTQNKKKKNSKDTTAFRHLFGQNKNQRKKRRDKNRKGAQKLISKIVLEEVIKKSNIKNPATYLSTMYGYMYRLNEGITAQKEILWSETKESQQNETE